MHIDRHVQTASFVVTAFYASEGTRYARAQFLIDVPFDRSPYATARNRAELSNYADPRIPGMTIFLLVTRRVPDRHEQMPRSVDHICQQAAFGCYVILSTTHIHCHTAQMLDRWADMAVFGQPLTVSRTRGGWFLSTRLAVTSGSTALPAELPALLAYGRSKGCDHILLDCDGPEQVDLPVYPW